MNAVRAVFSVFLLILLALTLMGWRWSAELPSPKQEGARVALALAGLSAVGGLGLLWSVKQRRSL
jgi:hypothetical protein